MYRNILSKVVNLKFSALHNNFILTSKQHSHIPLCAVQTADSSGLSTKSNTAVSVVKRTDSSGVDQKRASVIPQLIGARSQHVFFLFSLPLG